MDHDIKISTYNVCMCTTFINNSFCLCLCLLLSICMPFFNIIINVYISHTSSITSPVLDGRMRAHENATVRIKYLHNSMNEANKNIIILLLWSLVDFYVCSLCCDRCSVPILSYLQSFCSVRLHYNIKSSAFCSAQLYILYVERV